MADETVSRMPVFGAAAAAFALWRETLPRIWTTVVACGALSAGASFAMVRFAEANTGLYLLAQLLFVGIFSFAYGVQLAACLGLPNDPRRRVLDAMRLFAAISVIAFFLFIVFFAALIPGAIVMATSFPPAMADLASAEGDVEASMRLAEQMMREHWGPLLSLAIIYAAIWMFLTSRLYLAAPASVVEERVRTFETWRWTKGVGWRISAARLVLLFPAWLALTGIQAAFSALLGAGALNPTGMQNLMISEPIMYLALLAPMQILSLLVYSGLEAALSAYLFIGLRPKGAATGE